MEFKEYENPEQPDYDLKVGIQNPDPIPTKYNHDLDTDEGIDLNALGDSDWIPPEVDVTNTGYEINAQGEIIRPGRLR